MASNNEGYSKLAGWATAFFVCSIASYFFLLSRNVPLFADDYCQWGDGFDLHGALQSVKGHYFSWSGRFPVMFLREGFFSSGNIGIVLLDILNALALAAACYFAVVISGCGRSFFCRACLIVCFVFLLWFMPSVFGEVALWKSGTLQYFWGMVIATACLVPVIRFAVWDDTLPVSLVSKLLYSVLAFLAGAWLEILSPAVALVWLAALLFARFSRGKRVPLSLTIGLVCWIIGAAVLFVAPGNYARLELVASELSLWDRILHVTLRLPRIPSRSLLYLFVGFLLISILSGTPHLKRRLFTAAAFAGVAVLSAYATVGAPVLLMVGRTAFATEYFFIIAVVSMFPREVFAPPWTKSTGALRIGVLVISIGLVALLISDMRGTFNVYRWVSKQEAQRKELIVAAHQRGQETVELPPLIYSRRWNTGKGEVNFGRLFGRDIGYEPNEWPNGCYARAHGLKSVALRKR